MRDANRHRAGRNRFAGFTGALAAGLGVLAVVVLLAQVLGWVRGDSGPGIEMLVGHLAAAVVVIAAQLVVDRESGARAAICQGTIVVLTLAVLLLLWWL